ncbi:MAG: VWA-like domain-containing protein [Lachnospiraceae bacterium]|nr:VWA-like domain-containing protein [Lachnospiraceae bacterium]
MEKNLKSPAAIRAQENLTLESAAALLDTQEADILAFLKKRFRPLVLFLIEQHDMPRLRLLSQMKWLTAENANLFLSAARQSDRSDIVQFFLLIQSGHLKIGDTSAALRDQKPRKKDASSLCLRILEQCQKEIYSEFRYLDCIIFSLRPEPFPAASASSVLTGSNSPAALGTDGKHIYYNALTVLQLYRQSPSLIYRRYFHLILHILFLHIEVWKNIESKALPISYRGEGHSLTEMYFPGETGKTAGSHCSEASLSRWYHIACDILTEHYLDQLDVLCLAAPPDSFRRQVYNQLFKNGPVSSPPALLSLVMSSGFEPDNLEEEFHLDDHRFWSAPVRQAAEGNDRTLAGGSGDGSTALDSLHASSHPASEDAHPAHSDDALKNGEFQKLPPLKKEKYKTERLQKIFLHSLQKKRTSKAGAGAGNRVVDLLVSEKTTYDYASFLRRFASMGEELELDLDSFDLIYYTYGLSHYKKIPLIEPLEYRDLYKIQELVIAIDTSGSCSGQLVQRFLEETFSILGNENFFFRRCNLHLIQCDSVIQDHQVITCREEFEAYRHTPLKGFGGTDFRPVFQLTEKLIQEKEFQDLKGLIYFTDGQGVFPEKPPRFESAFVFVRQEDSQVKLPDWAIRLVLPHTPDAPGALGTVLASR